MAVNVRVWIIVNLLKSFSEFIHALDYSMRLRVRTNAHVSEPDWAVLMFAWIHRAVMRCMRAARLLYQPHSNTMPAMQLPSMDLAVAPVRGVYRAVPVHRKQQHTGSALQ